jgi:hypothetical protein
MQNQPPYGQPPHHQQHPQHPQHQQHYQQHGQHGQHQQHQQPLQHQQPPPAAGSGAMVNPRLQEALGTVDLLAGEQVVYTLQADGFFVGANPFLKLFAAIQAFMVTITGGHIRIFMVVTNQRLLVLKSTQMWCGVARMKSMHTIALAGLKEVGSSKETQLCCVNTRTVQVQSLTHLYNLVIKKMGDQEIRNFVTNLSAVIVAHTSRAGV